MIKRGADAVEIVAVIDRLAKDIPLDPKYLDHPLQGDKNDTRDCHIQNDWVLFYIKKARMRCSWSALALTPTFWVNN